MTSCMSSNPASRISQPTPSCKAAATFDSITPQTGEFGPFGRAERFPFGHTRRLEPQPRGAVTRRAVAQRRSRASGLTRPLTKAISRVLFSGFIPSSDGFGLWFLIWGFVHSRRRSYYLFFNYLFFNYLVGGSLSPIDQLGRGFTFTDRSAW